LFRRIVRPLAFAVVGLNTRFGLGSAGFGFEERLNFFLKVGRFLGSR